MFTRNIPFSRELISPDVHENLRNAIEAEKQGYDCVWVPDHLVDIPPPAAMLDAFTILSWVGSHTKTLRLASGVTDPLRIHPAKTANIIATLDHITRGRVNLGIGAGELMNTKPYGIPWEDARVRVARLEEAIKVVRLLWSSSSANPVNFDGEHYKLHAAHLDLHPFSDSSPPPIYIGAYTSSRLLEIVGEIADGWFPGSFFTVERYRERVSVIKNAASKSKRKIESIDRVASIPIVVDDGRGVEEEVLRRFKKNLLTEHYLLRLLGAEDILNQVPKELEYQLASPTPETTKLIEKTSRDLAALDEVAARGVEKMMAMGTPDRCIDMLERFLEAGATHIYVSSLITERENYDLVAKRIIPHFKSRQRGASGNKQA